MSDAAPFVKQRSTRQQTTHLGVAGPLLCRGSVGGHHLDRVLVEVHLRGVLAAVRRTGRPQRVSIFGDSEKGVELIAYPCWSTPGSPAPICEAWYAYVGSMLGTP